MGNKLGKKDLGKKKTDVLPKGFQRTTLVLHDTERELRIVKRIQEIFLTIPDDEMYAEVLDVILDAMDSKHGLFGYINPDDGSVVYPSMTSDVWDRCQIPEKNIVFPHETWGGMWGRSLREKKTLYSNKPFRVPQGHFPIKRSMSLPILYHNQLIGHIHVANKEMDYDEKDRALLETIAGHIAPVLHARRQREKQEEERKQAEKLIGIQRDLGIALSGVRNLEKALALVIDTATTLEGMDCGGIYLVDPDNGALHLQYAKGLSPDFIEQVSHYDKDSDNTRLVMKKKPVFVEYSKLKIKKRKVEHVENLEAIAVIPILHHGHVIACMNIASHTLKYFSASAQDALVAIASQAGSALARLQVEEKLAQYRQSLENQVEERTMGLRKANEQLRKEVSRRKEVNKELSESEERYRLLVETSHDLIWKCDSEGRFTYLNPAWEQTFGYKTEEMLGHHFTEFKTPEQAEKDLKTFKSILSGQEIYGYETTYISKSKETVFLVFNARIFKDPDGKIVGTQGTAYNITEYKRAEEQLRFQSKIVKNMSEGVNLVRASDHKIVFTNPKFDQMFGYSANELMGKHVSILNAPAKEQSEEVTKKIIESLNKNNYWQGEIKNIKKDGTLFWSSASISQFDHPKHGKVYISIQNDITERKWALEELRESEERYRTLVENIKIGITLIDADYNIVMINTATGGMFDKATSEFIGKKCYREFEKRKKVCDHCPGTRAMTTGLPQEVETEGVLDDGSRFQARVQAFPTFGADGKASGFIEVVEDISESKKTEEQISKLSHAVEQSPTAIVITDTTGNIEYVNPQFTRLTGYSSEEVLGKNPRFLKSGEQPTEFYQQLWDTINSGEVWHGEFHNKKKNGELYWESASISPIMDGEGAITHFVAIKEDITNRKKTEEELRQAREELEQRVKERTDELKQTFDQLLHAEKLSAIGKLSASIAHEFNNPLFGIRSVLEGVKMRGSFDKEDSELLELGIRECNRIKDLIVSLQEFNRPTSGEMKPMNIQQAIKDMLLLCKKEFKTRKITVEECYTTDLPEIQAVEDQVKQVILNLLKNAEEAIPKEGGIIKITTKRFKNKVAIQIHDSGVGIKAKDKNKIFDPFYSTKSSVKGAGLGLSVSYGIVKRHGGVVDVESKSNKGTTFTVTLPMKGRI